MWRISYTRVYYEDGEYVTEPRYRDYTDEEINKVIAYFVDSFPRLAFSVINHKDL